MKKIITYCSNRVKANILFVFALFLLFVNFNSFAQEVTTKIDSTVVKIGEELKLEFLVNAKPTSTVIFPEAKVFGQLEVINSYKIDTLKKGETLQLLKKYGLTQFDSGYYKIPSQKILINNKPFVTDSLLVEVKDVVVDTTKQNLYDIKPIIEVEKPSGGFPWWIVYVILGIGVLFGLLYLLFFRKTKKQKELESKLPPFEEAIKGLTALDNGNLLEQSEYKKYYSGLTDVLKKYLDEEIYDNALESTSDELIAKLELLRDSGELPLSSEIIQNLRTVLQTSDLVKFAKSQPDQGTARVDRDIIENTIKEAKAALPDPTEEELLLNEQYRLKQEAKQKKRKIIYASITGVALVLLIITGFAIKYGYDTVKDTLIGHPTKELLEEKNWIRSEYGNPAIVVTTPKVLKRVASEQLDAMGMQTFVYGSITSNFSITVNTTKIPEQALAALNQQEKTEEEKEPEIDLEQVNEASLKMLEQQGAKDILVKQEEYNTSKGLKGMKAFGSLSMENPLSKEFQSVEYQILTFGQNKAIQQVLIFYQKSDQYAEKIVERVLKSVELKKSEE